MNDPRWTTVDGLLEAALERDPQERAAFLREACAGSETLRREVESLLAHARAEDFLERPAHDVMGRPPTQGNEWSAGHSLGPYRIIGLLGRGGMAKCIARTTRLSAATSPSNSCHPSSPGPGC